MNSRLTIRGTVTMVAGLVAMTLASEARAATPTYWDNRTDFEASLTQSVTDTYDDPDYVDFQDDAAMSAAFGETDYTATAFANNNYVFNIGFDPFYCAGCATFELGFTDTSVGTSQGVNAVGLDVEGNDVFGTPYYAYITFSDGTTDEYLLPGSGFFFGVSAPEQIERIHIGLAGGLSTTFGYFYLDNLTIGRQLCGNGVIDPDEECDDGGETAECDSNCTFVFCGDGTPNQAAGEECDTAGDSADCNFDCTFVECGDEYINAAAGEVCDDGPDQTDSATCDGDCTAVECGDGYHNRVAGELCDDGGDSADCNFDCTPAECGDGYANEAAGEVCDESGDTLTCDGDCTLVECGDGYLNEAVGEVCDDPEGSATCDVDCTLPECGDGLWNEHAGEECDGDGKGTPGETVVCNLDCTLAECGDGVINETRGEECDDGNVSDGDGCTSFCIIEDWGSSGESGEPASSEESGPIDPTPGDETSASSMVSDSTTGTVDTDTDTDGTSAAGDSGCGCSSRSKGQGGLLALALLVLGAIRRRRRE